MDGRVTDGTAVVDESAVTGEPLPVERAVDQDVRGGTVNAGGPFRMRATTDARASAFAVIVRLAREAEAHTRLWPGIEALVPAAETLVGGGTDQRAETVSDLRAFLEVPPAHEQRAEQLLYPRVADVLGRPDTTATMSREHTEIAELTRRLRAALDEVEDAPDGGGDARRYAARVAIELYAVLRRHFAQGEGFHVLAAVDDGPRNV
ncbi:hemerythrin domain-containing protein [Nocardiopsis sp. CC223A]|uniref:P-type ATPase n=1 Tax=Nocardiopsis sp. CC223A TaxID=3044051 RepID=UPI002795BA63|nr:hemerythrin domain-containing protein [Nocardiopsis sp. CC223A]